MSSLQDRLLKTEEDFLLALTEGEDAITAFDERWQRLVDEVDRLHEADALSTEISTLAHDTAVRVATLAEVSAEIFATRNILTSQLVSELDVLLSQLSLQDTPSPTSVPSPPSSDTEGYSCTPPRLLLGADPTEPCTRGKRKCHSEYVEGHERVALDRPNKRICTNSVVSSTGEFLVSSAEQTTVLNTVREYVPISAANPPIAEPPISRKRRRSEGSLADVAVGPSKRRYVGPRLHAASDTFLSIRTPSIPIDNAAISSSTVACTNNVGLRPPPGPLDIKALDDLLPGTSLLGTCDLSILSLPGIQTPSSPSNDCFEQLPVADGLDDFISSLLGSPWSLSPSQSSPISMPTDLTATLHSSSQPASPAVSSSSTSDLSWPSTPSTNGSVNLTRAPLAQPCGTGVDDLWQSACFDSSFTGEGTDSQSLSPFTSIPISDDWDSLLNALNSMIDTSQFPTSPRSHISSHSGALGVMLGAAA